MVGRTICFSRSVRGCSERVGIGSSSEVNRNRTNRAWLVLIHQNSSPKERMPVYCCLLFYLGRDGEGQERFRDELHRPSAQTLVWYVCGLCVWRADSSSTSHSKFPRIFRTTSSRIRVWEANVPQSCRFWLRTSLGFRSTYEHGGENA